MLWSNIQNSPRRVYVLTLLETLKNYQKISLDIERAILDEDDFRIQQLDTEYEMLAETILTWRADSGEEQRLLTRFLLDNLSDPKSRTPLEKRVVKRLAELVEFGLLGSAKC